MSLRYGFLAHSTLISASRLLFQGQTPLWGLFQRTANYTNSKKSLELQTECAFVNWASESVT